MGWIKIAMYIIIDLMVINFIINPTGTSAKTGEPWLPEETLETGKNLDYTIKTYNLKYGLSSSTIKNQITTDAGNNVLMNGEITNVEGGRQSSSTASTEGGSSIELIRPIKGLSGMTTGEEEFKVNKYSLKATGSGGPSTAWNQYVYHPALYSFIENQLAKNNKWLYLSTDGYAYQVNVVGREEDTYIIDIEYKNLDKDRLWIDINYPTPIRREHFTKSGEVLLSTELMT